MDKLRVGIIGVGGHGRATAQHCCGGRAAITAICDANPAALEGWDDLPTFTSSEELIRSGLVDAVYIATPHHSHATIGIDALQNGLHVLVEKPIVVHKADAERLVAAHRDRPAQVFAAMFNERTDPRYRRLREMVAAGELGEIRRVNWIITTWYRTDGYFPRGGWRGTWRGDGGGVLMNQCPHSLDILQWIWEMPGRVMAHCAFGKYHDIEVEDEVTAYLEYPNGATGVFVTSTGEAPGTNRLEIIGDNGKVTVERGSPIVFVRNKVPMDVFRRGNVHGSARPETETIEIPIEGRGGQHREICENFLSAILEGSPLIAPAEEGIRSVELANAMLLSSWLGEAVDIPMDAQLYECHLQRLIVGSRQR